MRKSYFWLGFLFAIALAVGSTNAQTAPLYFPPTSGAAWATTAPASLGWCQPPLDSLLAFAGRKGSKSLLILKDGRLVVERYYGTYTVDSVHYWASAGKTLVAALVGVAQQDGLLNINDSTSRFLGRGWTTAPPAKERLITVRHQLTMTTGLNDLLPPTPQVPDPDNCLQPACLQYLADAGTRWAYYNGPYRLLQNVVANASGMPFQQYTRQRLGNRIGMAGFWFDYTYYSRARDMARFGLLVLARGSWNGTPVLTDPAYFQAMTTPSQTLNRSYGYLWWLNGQSSHKLPGTQQTTFPGPLVPAAPADMIAALGKDDQKIYVVPSLGLVVVRQGSSAGARSMALSSFDNELWTKIMAVLCRPTAAAAAAAAAGFLAFPNPAAETLTLRQPAQSAAAVRLLDGLGREVVRQRTAAPETTVAVNALAPGLYTAQWLDHAGRVLASRKVARQ